ncbi:FtsH protease activity modulator HflK [Utexia brackfieldae]|uniref:FtsH protease activity modulator HflK n=1 Tax=Utexia brackfieldae TaxID=3074108 RepID=UPI00370DAFA2
MAWNQPGNNGQDNDPWGSNKRKNTQSSASIVDKLNNLFKKSNGGHANGGRSINFSFIIIGVLVVIAVIWAASGFYTISQSQHGVVTRLGKVQTQLVDPGLNWSPTFIDKVYRVDTQGTRSLNVKGFMITAGENLMFVEMNVQYRVSNPIKYLFNVTNVDDSLSQAADSALRTEIGMSKMDDIITKGRTLLEFKTKESLIDIIKNYDMGISIVDLNFQSVRPPKNVQDAFNDAIQAREDRERLVNEARAERAQREPQAEGQALRIVADANAYKLKVELEAQGEVARFELLLPEYRLAPELTRERLYINMMEHVLSNTNKVLISDKNNNLMVFPLEQMLKNRATNNNEKANNTTETQSMTDLIKTKPSSDTVITSKPETTHYQSPAELATGRTASGRLSAAR